MPALNFQKRFAPSVESGKKRQTIRACRRDGRNPRVGHTLYLYTGQRTKYCRKLGEAVCKSSEIITIDENYIFVEGKILTDHECAKLAIADGFEYVEDFKGFFSQNHDGLPFTGYLIKW